LLGDATAGGPDAAAVAEVVAVAVADAVAPALSVAEGGGGIAARTGAAVVAAGRATRSAPRDDHIAAMPTTAPIATATPAT
jgi:hypothetical protein